MTKTQSVVNVGVVGAGRVAVGHHLPALQALPGARVAALAEVDAGRLASVADRFNISARYTSYDQLLARPEIDVVAVCVPPQHHGEVVLAALQAGKHVFVEKPLALSVPDCDRMIAAAAEAGRKAMVGFNLRQHRLFRQAQQIIARGDVGAVEAVCTLLTSGYRYHHQMAPWRSRWAAGGGVLLEIGSHHFDLLRFLLRTEMTEIFAQSRRDHGAEDTVTFIAQMQDGVQVTSLFSQATGAALQVEVFGVQGRLTIDGHAFDGLTWLPTGSHAGGLKGRAERVLRTLRELRAASATIRRGGDFAATYLAEWEHFLDCLRRDQPVDPTLQDGRQALRVALAAMQSLRTRMPVQIAAAPNSVADLEH